MTFKLYTDVALTRDVSDFGLCRGDVAKLIDHHPVPDGEDGYSIEVCNARGETIAVTMVSESALALLRSDQVLAVRRWVAP